ncbi:MAG: alpha/beta hydrolase [Comamonadaceae bacterium]|nr:MAG: alpha/beta hydrolase [Comamonadaceae bacterium]
MTTVTTTSGQAVDFIDHGGDGPALVLLHSFLMDGSMFSPQVTTFGSTYRCITIDERGHGNTPLAGDFSFWDVARDVVTVLDYLGIDTASLVGTSQGGFVALRVALLAPERVRSVVAVGTSASSEEPAVAATYRQIADTWAKQGPVEPLLDTVAHLCLGEADATDWKAKWRGISGEHLAAILKPLVGRDDIVGRLGEIHAPVLVLHGDADAAYPPEKAEQIVEHLPNARLTIVPEGAHFLSLTHPNPVNASLVTFLKLS